MLIFNKTRLATFLDTFQHHHLVLFLCFLCWPLKPKSNLGLSTVTPWPHPNFVSNIVNNWCLSKQRINMDRTDLNYIINRLDLTDSYRKLDQITDEYTLFSSSNGTFTNTDHILGHKKTLNKF